MVICGDLIFNDAKLSRFAIDFGPERVVPPLPPRPPSSSYVVLNPFSESESSSEGKYKKDGQEVFEMNEFDDSEDEVD